MTNIAKVIYILVNFGVGFLIIFENQKKLLFEMVRKRLKTPQNPILTKRSPSFFLLEISSHPPPLILLKSYKNPVNNRKKTLLYKYLGDF